VEGNDWEKGGGGGENKSLMTTARSNGSTGTKRFVGILQLVESNASKSWFFISRVRAETIVLFRFGFVMKDRLLITAPNLPDVNILGIVF
jgi:hypothetical protein